MARPDPRICSHRRRSLPDRRAEKRILCSDLVRLQWKSAEGVNRDEIGILEDLSTSGASVFLGVPVDKGAAVRLIAADQEFPGEACRCSREENGYLVGVRFAPVPESPEEEKREYVPEHLLDVSRLDFS